MSGGDWHRKTARLRDLERRIQQGEHPTSEEVAGVLRHALTEMVGDLPIGPELVAYMAGTLDGTLRLPRGRPVMDSEAVWARRERALEMSYAVEVRYRELRRVKVPQPKASAIDQVAREHHMAPDTLRSLVSRGPANNPLPWPWKKQVRLYIEDIEDVEKWGR